MYLKRIYKFCAADGQLRVNQETALVFKLDGARHKNALPEREKYLCVRRHLVQIIHRRVFEEQNNNWELIEKLLIEKFLSLTQYKSWVRYKRINQKFPCRFSRKMLLSRICRVNAYVSLWACTQSYTCMYIYEQLWKWSELKINL